MSKQLNLKEFFDKIMLQHKLTGSIISCYSCVHYHGEVGPRALMQTPDRRHCILFQTFPSHKRVYIERDYSNPKAIGIGYKSAQLKGNWKFERVCEKLELK